MSSDNNHSQFAIAASYVGALARFSFCLAGIFFFLVVGIPVWLIWSWFNGFVPVDARPVMQITAASELARLQYSSRAEKTGYGWQETLQFGQLYDRDTDFRLIVSMPSNPSPTRSLDVFSELRAIGPIAGANFYPPSNYDLETRFGPVRAAKFQIWTDGRIKLCASFLSRFDSPALTFKGWYCEANGAGPSMSSLACILDRAALKAPLPSPAAQSFFTQHASRPPRCSAEPVSQTTDTRPAQPPRILRRL